MRLLKCGMVIFITWQLLRILTGGYQPIDAGFIFDLLPGGHHDLKYNIFALVIIIVFLVGLKRINVSQKKMHTKEKPNNGRL